MSKETKWTRVSREIEPLVRAAVLQKAWELIEKAIREEPWTSDSEELVFLHRATMLAAQYGEYKLATSWVETHKRFRQTELDDKARAAYQAVRLAIELSCKNYSEVERILRELDWRKAPAASWTFNVRLACAVRQNYRSGLIELLRRPSKELTTPPEFQDPYDRGNRLRLLANYQLMRSEWRRCSGYLRAAFRQYSQVKEIDARLKEVVIWGTWGIAAYYEGRLEEAEEHLGRAVEAAAELHHPRHHDRLRIELANVYLDRGENSRAQELLLSVVEASGRQPQIDAFHFTRARAMIDLGDIALESGEATKASHYLKEAGKLLSRRAHPRLMGYLHLLRGRIAASAKSTPGVRKALKEFQRAEAAFLSLGDGDNHGLYMAGLRRAQVYLGLKSVKKAMAETIRCMEFAKASRHKPRQAQCLLLKSKLLLERNIENHEGIYEEILAGIGSVRNPVMLFKIVANLYLYTWDLRDQVDLTDYHLRQIHKMSEILDRETFQRLYEKHVSRRVLQRALIRTFGVSPSLFEEEPDSGASHF